MKKNQQSHIPASDKDRFVEHGKDGSVSTQRKRPASSHTSLGARILNRDAKLSSSRRRLLTQILDESDETFFLSSREMAQRYGVDSATVIRTIQALGYSKFADFAHDLRQHFVTQITPYSAMKAAAQTDRSIT